MRWGKSDCAECGLCSEPGHLEHILSSCRTALTQRRFTWRHDKVLRKLAHHVELKRVNANKVKTKRVKKDTIEFVKTGQTARKKTNTTNTEHSVGLLNRATDWELRVSDSSSLLRLKPD